MGQVIFTIHTLTRCRQRHINPITLKKRIESLPPFTGELKWTFSRNMVAVMQRQGDNIIVVTVIRKQRKRR